MQIANQTVQEQIYELLFYLKGTLRYKWTAFIIASVVCISSWLFVSAMPNKYTSQAKVHVETGTMLQPLLRGMTIQSDVKGMLRVMQLLMFTQSNLEQIIKLSDLGENIKTAFDREQLIEDLKNDIKIDGGANEIFTIQYEAQNPDMAKNVVQAVLTVFSEQTQMSTLAGSDVAHHFIDEQIQEYETRLRNGEKARENFKRANLGFLPGQGGDQIGQIQQMTTALEDAKLILKEAVSRKETLKAQLDEALASGAEDDEWSDMPLNGSSDDPQIAALKQKKDELLIKYTRNHPEVIYIEKTIKELEKHNAQKRVKTEEAGGLDSTVMTNPYVQNIKVSLNEADALISAINSRVSILESRLQKAKEELNTRLSIETEMQNLNRDYESIKRNYDQLLASKEVASMSKKVDDQAEALKFKIADAPNTPLQPSSPNRKLLFSLTLVFGVLFGWLMAFLVYLIRPTVMSTSKLKEVTGLPVLGNISMKTNAITEKATRSDTIRFSAASVVLLMLYVSFMTLEILHVKMPNVAQLLQFIR